MDGVVRYGGSFVLGVFLASLLFNLKPISKEEILLRSILHYAETLQVMGSSQASTPVLVKSSNRPCCLETILEHIYI
jgi:hypothetical protein